MFGLGKVCGHMGIGQCQRVGSFHEIPLRPPFGVNLRLEGTKGGIFLQVLGRNGNKKKTNIMQAIEQ